MKKNSRYIQFVNVCIAFLIMLILHSCGDKCRNVDCVNGTCDEGECLCDERWNGTNCDEQITPTSIKIIEFNVKQHPETRPNGGQWDLISDAELMISLWQNNEIIYSSGYYTNVSEFAAYPFIPMEELAINDLGSVLTIELLDFDDILDQEIMSTNDFEIYSSTNKFPTSIVIDDSNGTEVEVALEYEFN